VITTLSLSLPPQLAFFFFLKNLLFSICRFNEVVGAYPTKITVVGYTFKAYRFESLHRPALGIEKFNFNYIGIQPDLASKFDLLKAEKVFFCLFLFSTFFLFFYVSFLF
jgi:hypothetical protein